MFAAASTNIIQITSILLRIFNYLFKNCLIKTFKIKNFIEIEIFGSGNTKITKRRNPCSLVFSSDLSTATESITASPAAATSFSSIPSSPYT